MRSFAGVRTGAFPSEAIEHETFVRDVLRAACDLPHSQARELDRLLLVVLAYALHVGPVDVDDLADWCGAMRMPVSASLRQLQARGWISVEIKDGTVAGQVRLEAIR